MSLFNPNQPHRKFKAVKSWDPETNGPDFILQNGVYYAWSESNVRYEPAWWLFNPIDDVATSLVSKLREERQIGEEILDT